MRPGFRVAAIFLFSSIAIALGGFPPAGAQSLSDAAMPGLAQPPAAIGAWTTSVAPEPWTQGWVPVTVRVWLAPPSHLAAIAPPLKGSEEALPARGPRLTGTTHALSGMASYYSQGETTAAGEHFDPAGMTAAHKTLPFGTRVRVTRVDTGDSVVVRINDRGPFKPGRVIDLSQGAAQNLGMMSSGLTAVRLEVLGQ